MLHLALSLALATCPTPPEGTVVTNDAELAVALDAADRAAWALRDAETLLFARRAWNAREGRLRAAGEASAHGAIDVRFVDHLLELVDTTATADGSLVATGQTIAGVALPDLRGIELLEVDDALQLLSDLAEDLAAARAARVTATADDCGSLRIHDPGPAAPTGLWGPFVEEASEVHLGHQADAALARADHSAETIEGIIARMRDLATQSASETLDNGERVYVQDRFVALSYATSSIVSRRSWHGHPLHQGLDTDVELPDLYDWNLGIDTASIDMSTAATGSAAIPALDFALETVSETRSGYELDQSTLPLTPPSLPAVTVDGATSALDCAEVDTERQALLDTLASLAAWQEEAATQEAALVELQAGQLRLSTEARPPPPTVPDPTPALAVLPVDPGPLDEHGYPALSAVLDGRVELAAERWRVAIDQQLVHFDALRIHREAVRCQLPAVAPTWPTPPVDPTDQPIRSALQANRQDAIDFIGVHTDVVSDALTIVAAMRAEAAQGASGGADLATHETTLLALEAELAGLLETDWHGISFDGTTATLGVTVGGNGDWLAVTVGDVTPSTLGADPSSHTLSTHEAFWSLVPSLDTALDILRSYESQLAAARWRIQVEAYLAEGP